MLRRPPSLTSIGRRDSASRRNSTSARRVSRRARAPRERRASLGVERAAQPGVCASDRGVHDCALAQKVEIAYEWIAERRVVRGAARQALGLFDRQETIARDGRRFAVACRERRRELNACSVDAWRRLTRARIAAQEVADSLDPVRAGGLGWCDRDGPAVHRHEQQLETTLAVLVQRVEPVLMNAGARPRGRR
jgi:hypothetical protein